MPEVCSNRVRLRQKAQARYGMPGKEVEQEYLDLLESCRTADLIEADETQAAIGRRVIE